MDANAAKNPIVEKFKAACKEVKLAVSEPTEDDPVDTVFRVGLMSEDTTHIAIVIYDSTKRFISIQIATLEENDGQTTVLDDAISLRMSLSKGDGARLEKSLKDMASEIASFLTMSDLDSENEDDDESDGDDEDNDELEGGDEAGEEWKP